MPKRVAFMDPDDGGIVKIEPSSQPDLTTWHQCRNFDEFVELAKLDPTDPGIAELNRMFKTSGRDFSTWIVKAAECRVMLVDSILQEKKIPYFISREAAAIDNIPTGSAYFDLHRAP